MHIRLRDKKVKAAVKKEAKDRKCSNARAVEINLAEHFAIQTTKPPVPVLPPMQYRSPYGPR
jgi:hypothetical protein